MQHETHRVPVTALAFWDQDVVLAGDGGRLRAYDLKTGSLLASAHIFQGQAIHGLVTQLGKEEAEVVVLGGHEVCWVRLTRQSANSIGIKIGAITTADDWILHAAFCPSTSIDKSNNTAALVTAHNALVLVKVRQHLRPSLEPIVSGSNCILYCAQVKWLSASHCLIASGTVFGDVIVWSCFLPLDDESLSISHQTHYAFPAHEGSVFGVELSTSDTAEAVGGYQHILATCSDDRTIRVWDVSDLSRQAPQLSEQQQETGFGAKGAGGHDPPLLAKTMGHISRIWHLRFLHCLGEGEVYVLSFGEDAQCITWVLETTALAGANAAYKLTQLNSQRLHNGKNIWSLTVDDSRRVATGGADGALVWFHFADAKSLQSQQGQISHPSDTNVAKGDNYRSYAFVGKGSLMATTDQGQLVLISLDGETCQASAVSNGLPELRGYSLVTSAPGVAFIAGAKGKVYSYVEHTSDLQPLLTTDRKVAGLFLSDPFPQSKDDSSCILNLLVTNVGSSVALYSSVIFSQIEGTITKKDERKLILPDGFVVTSFASRSSSGETIVVLGSRTGSIAAYRITGHTEQLLSPAMVSTGVHGQETVTKLVLLSQEGKTASDNICLFSTGRDGTFAVHQVQLNSIDATLATEHQLQLPFGPNIEGLKVTAHGDVWVWGFRGKQFVVFDISTQQEIMAVECGGVHRNWAFQSNNGGGTFVWTKASKLYFARQEHLPHSTANSGGHGREIKCVAVSPVDSGVFATGAEDTDIKLNRYENSSFRCLHTLQKHVTGIQHLQWSTDGRYLFSSGGVEEFLVWRIAPDVPHLGIGVTCESRHPRSGTSDLRITSFAIQDQQKTDHNHDHDPSTFHITMVYSDSTVRSWHYHHQTWILLASGDYLTSCLTLCLRRADDANLITASTDGSLTTWSSAPPGKRFSWTTRHQVHQSAILSSIPLDLAGARRLIISGGDDNAIGITLLAGPGAFGTLLVPRAHAAAVTALVAVRCGEGGVWFASASIDQRVKLWRVDVDARKTGSDMVDVTLLANVFTAVADVSSMETIRCEDGRQGLLVAGVGLDVWKVPRLEAASG